MCIFPCWLGKEAQRNRGGFRKGGLFTLSRVREGRKDGMLLGGKGRQELIDLNEAFL